jgi:NADH-quinone oxidoreductase subunit C
VSPATAPSIDLAALGAQTLDANYAADGFHHRHTATADTIVRLAQAFQSGGWFCEMITAEDRRADEQAMRLVYTFNRFDTADRHAVFVTIAGAIPGVECPSIAGACKAANWLEREIYDMYGVRFTGHPDLKRILLPEDADFHALLKDFGRIEDAPGNPATGADGSGR